MARARAFRTWRRAAPDVVVEDVNKVPLFLPVVTERPFVRWCRTCSGPRRSARCWPVAAVVWPSERPMPRVYRRAAVHAISESTRDDLVDRGFRASAIRVIYPGVDTAASPDRSPPWRRPSADLPVRGTAEAL